MEATGLRDTRDEVIPIGEPLAAHKGGVLQRGLQSGSARILASGSLGRDRPSLGDVKVTPTCRSRPHWTWGAVWSVGFPQPRRDATLATGDDDGTVLPLGRNPLRAG